MSNGAEAETLTRQGMEALKANDKTLAYSYLTEAVRLDAKNQLAWLWLSGAVDETHRRRYCLEQVIAIDSHNELGKRAQAGIERLKTEEQPRLRQEQIIVVVPQAPAPSTPSSSLATRLGVSKANKLEQRPPAIDILQTTSSKAPVITKTYKNSAERDKDVERMARQGYVIQSIMSEDGNFKSGKAAALGIGGAVLFGPLGLAAGALAGRKDSKWHVVYVLQGK